MKESEPRVVIVGAGFGGLSCAQALARAPVEITLIDRQNHHLFQPLLYQVATAGLSPADIAWPVRRMLRRQKNVEVLLGEVSGADVHARTVRLGEKALAYDFLVLATGATHAYFGKDEWEPYAPGLKQLDDATDIRQRILMAFERAEIATDPDEREALLTFVVVGAGPTGVELAGAIAELAKRALASDFRHIDPTQARIVLVEAGPRVLTAFPEKLSAYSERALERLGVEVRTGHPITSCSSHGVTLDKKEVPARTIIWAAGVAASRAAEWLGVESDRAGRVPVDAELRPTGLEDVFVVGDTALFIDESGAPLPGVAPVAKQQGVHVGRLIRAAVEGRGLPGPFRYRNWGNMATIGRRAAVIDWGTFRLRGRLAWWLWGFVHIYFLINLRSRLIVAIQWLWSYLMFDSGARLITGLERRNRGVE